MVILLDDNIFVLLRQLDILKNNFKVEKIITDKSEDCSILSKTILITLSYVICEDRLALSICRARVIISIFIAVVYFMPFQLQAVLEKAAYQMFPMPTIVRSA